MLTKEILQSISTFLVSDTERHFESFSVCREWASGFAKAAQEFEHQFKLDDDIRAELEREEEERERETTETGSYTSIPWILTVTGTLTYHKIPWKTWDLNSGLGGQGKSEHIPYQLPS